MDALGVKGNLETLDELLRWLLSNSMSKNSGAVEDTAIEPAVQKSVHCVADNVAHRSRRQTLILSIKLVRLK
jgi:hypothetical protein